MSGAITSIHVGVPAGFASEKVAIGTSPFMLGSSTKNKRSILRSYHAYLNEANAMLSAMPPSC
jgi:hypothetical protein